MPNRNRRDPWVILLGVFTAIMGLVNVLSALTPSEKYRLQIIREYLPPFIRASSRLSVALAGVFLLYIARGIFRRKRHAWFIAIILLSVSTLTHLAKGLDWEESAMSALMVVGLAMNSRKFRATSDRASVRTGIFALVWAFCISFMYGVLGFYLLDRHFHENFSFLEAARATMRVFFTFSAPPMPYSRLAEWFLASIETVSIAAFAVSTWLVLRPVVQRRITGQAENARAYKILSEHGRSSFVRFTVWDDKTLFFSGSMSAYISYKVVGDIALVLGDPVGPREELPGILEEFTDFCRDNDWSPSYYQTLDTDLAAYKEHGMQVLKIGEEAVVDLKAWNLQGGDKKNFRNLVNRFNKLGFEFSVVPPFHGDALIAELKGVSDEWLATRHGAEKTFSLGYFSTEYVRECPIAIVRSPLGRIEAFANIIPEYSINQGTFDMMRHRDTAPKGIMEFLMVQLAGYFKDEGMDSFNLGLAPLSGTGEGKDAPALEKGIKLIYQYVNQFYNFKGLRMFKEKFDPEWEPRYLVYPGMGSLLRVVYAVINANSGGRLSDYVYKK